MNPTLSKLRKTFTSNWVVSQEGSKQDSLNSLTNPFQLTQSSWTSDQNKRTRFETLLESQRSSEINKSLLNVANRLEQYDQSNKALIESIGETNRNLKELITLFKTERNHNYPSRPQHVPRDERSYQSYESRNESKEEISMSEYLSKKKNAVQALPSSSRKQQRSNINSSGSNFSSQNNSHTPLKKAKYEFKPDSKCSSIASHDLFEDDDGKEEDNLESLVTSLETKQTAVGNRNIFTANEAQNQPSASSTGKNGTTDRPPQAFPKSVSTVPYKNANNRSDWVSRNNILDTQTSNNHSSFMAPKKKQQPQQTTTRGSSRENLNMTYDLAIDSYMTEPIEYFR